MRALRLFMAFMAATGVAGAITVLTVISDEVEAKASAQAGKPVALGPDCAQQAWPYYESHCIRRPAAQSLRAAGRAQANAVHIVSVDRRARAADRD